MKLKSLFIFLLGSTLFFSKPLLATSIEPSNSEQLLTVHEIAIQDTQYEIEKISNFMTQGSEKELLELYNARGIRYFCCGLFEEAIDDFNQALDILSNKEAPEMGPIGLAIWIRMLCHAYQNCEEEAVQDLNLFRSYFLSECSPCMNSREVEEKEPLFHLTSNHDSKSPRYHSRNDHLSLSNSIQLIAQFADPSERLSSDECKLRVRETAKIMRLLSAKIKNNSLVGLINLAISEIEEFMCNCCNRNHWTECLSPIIDAYKYMKGCMDKGAAIAPRVIWPGR